MLCIQVQIPAHASNPKNVWDNVVLCDIHHPHKPHLNWDPEQKHTCSDLLHTCLALAGWVLLKTVLWALQKMGNILYASTAAVKAAMASAFPAYSSQNTPMLSL